MSVHAKSAEDFVSDCQPDVTTSRVLSPCDKTAYTKSQIIEYFHFDIESRQKCRSRASACEAWVILNSKMFC